MSLRAHAIERRPLRGPGTGVDHRACYREETATRPGTAWTIAVLSIGDRYAARDWVDHRVQSRGDRYAARDRRGHSPFYR